MANQPKIVIPRREREEVVEVHIMNPTPLADRVINLFGSVIDEEERPILLFLVALTGSICYLMAEVADFFWRTAFGQMIYLFLTAGASAMSARWWFHIADLRVDGLANNGQLLLGFALTFGFAIAFFAAPVVRILQMVSLEDLQSRRY